MKNTSSLITSSPLFVWFGQRVCILPRWSGRIEVRSTKVALQLVSTCHFWVPSGKLTVCYWTWPETVDCVDLAISLDGDFPSWYVCQRVCFWRLWIHSLDHPGSPAVVNDWRLSHPSERYESLGMKLTGKKHEKTCPQPPTKDDLGCFQDSMARELHISSQGWP